MRTYTHTSLLLNPLQHYPHYEGVSRAVWLRLKSQYEKTTKSALKHLLSKFVELQQRDKTVAQFVSEALTLKQRIKDIVTESKADLLEEMAMTVLIGGLPRNREVIKQQLLLDETLTTEKCARIIMQSNDIDEFTPEYAEDLGPRHLGSAATATNPGSPSPAVSVSILNSVRKEDPPKPPRTPIS